MVDCQLEILEFLVIYNDVIDRQRLVLIGNSKLFLARLASQARRASSWFVLSLCVKFNLFSSKLLNSTLRGVHHVPGPYINTYNKVSRKRAKDVNKSVTLFSVFDFEL